MQRLQRNLKYFENKEKNKTCAKGLTAVELKKWFQKKQHCGMCDAFDQCSVSFRAPPIYRPNKPEPEPAEEPQPESEKTRAELPDHFFIKVPMNILPKIFALKNGTQKDVFYTCVHGHTGDRNRGEKKITEPAF